MKQGWEIKKLGEVATYVNGYAFKPDHWADDGVPIIRIQNLNNQDAVYNYCNMDIPKKFVVEYGDILISWSASLGVYEWLGERSYLNQHIFKVVFDKCNINKYFFKYAVSGKINEMLKNAHGATMKHIVKKDFDNTEIIYPSIAEQERIVGELDCLSGIIANKRAQLRELDTLAQSIFYTMFGDPITNDKGWQTKALGDVARIINGYAFDSKLFSTDKNDMPLIRIRDIKKGYTETFYKGKYPNTYIIKNGDYIIGMDGEFNIVEWRGGTALLNQRVCKIEFIDDEVIGRYALRFLSIELKRIEDATSFVTVKHLSSKSLISIFIPIPPIDLQKQFAEKIENIERQKELITKSIKETEDLFNSRMSYYFE